MASKDIHEVAEYKPIIQYGMEELAARQRSIKPTGGVLFARNADGEEKSEARQRVLDLFDPARWEKNLHILTMPGLHWRFERKLLGTREVGWMRSASPQRTFFTSVESDRSIFYAGVAQMPGLHTPDALLKSAKGFGFSEKAVKTQYATFLFANVEDVMNHEWESAWDAAWLDYTGPLSAERLQIITRFYAKYVREILVITSLNARWDKPTSQAITDAGGYSNWWRQSLKGDVLHEFEYMDTSPMVQMAIRKTQEVTYFPTATFPGRDHGGSSMKINSQLKKEFGELEVIEAKEPLRLQPIRHDVDTAVPKDSGCCVFARCAQRQFGATRVVFWRRIAYVDLVGKDGVRRIERFIVNRKMRDLIEQFDQGLPFNEGSAFILNPPTARMSRRVQRLHWRKYRRTPIGAAKQKAMNQRAYRRELEQKIRELNQQLLILGKQKRKLDKKQIAVLVDKIGTLRKSLKEARLKEKEAIAELAKTGEQMGRQRTRKYAKDFDVRNGSGHYNIVTEPVIRN